MIQVSLCYFRMQSLSFTGTDTLWTTGTPKRTNAASSRGRAEVFPRAGVSFQVCVRQVLETLIVVARSRHGSHNMDV